MLSVSHGQAKTCFFISVQRQQLEEGAEGAAEGVAEAEAVVKVQSSCLILNLHTATCGSILGGSCAVWFLQHYGSCFSTFGENSALIMRLASCLSRLVRFAACIQRLQGFRGCIALCCLGN